MNDLAARTADIEQYLTEHFLEMLCAPKPFTKFEWQNHPLPDPSNLHRPYGWVPPFEIEIPAELESGKACVLAPFCAQVIAEQTAELDETELVIYLDTIRFSTAVHVAHRGKPWEEREKLVENMMWDEGEDSLVVMNKVQMEALDKIVGQ